MMKWRERSVATRGYTQGSSWGAETDTVPSTTSIFPHHIVPSIQIDFEDGAPQFLKLHNAGIPTLEKAYQ